LVSRNDSFDFPVIADTGGLLGLFLGCSVLSVVELFYFFIVFMLKKFVKSPQIGDDKKSEIKTIECAKIPEGCSEKFENMQQQLTRLQRIVMSLQVQLQNSRESVKKFNNQELSVEAFLHRHSNNINRDLVDILSNIDEDLRKHRKIIKMRPM
jgi:uncharacterized membrane protein YhiD involved in acid resistance